MMISVEDFTPIGDFVLIKADPRVKKTSGGIYLTEDLIGIERVMEGSGTLLKISDRVREETKEFDITPGSRVFYRGFLKDCFKECFEKIDDCDVFALSYKDILGVLGKDMTVGQIY